MPNTELYSRQEELSLDVPSAATVVGLGGIGSWVAIFLAMSGMENLYLFDPDIMEESNRNRLPFCQSSINRPKVDVVADYIRGIRPDCNVVAVAEKLEGMLLDIQIGLCAYFFDCTDSPKSQFTLYKKCQENNRTFIRAGYDGTHITVTSNVSGWIRTEVEQENYAIAPSWVIPSVVVAALAVGKLEKFNNQEVSLDLSEIGVPIIQRRTSGRLTARCTQVRHG